MQPCFSVSPWLAVATFAVLPSVSSLLAQEVGAARTAPANPTNDAAGIEFFEKSIRPLLASRCFECHGAQKQKGSLRLDSRAAALKGGDTAPAVIPGKPEESLLVDAIRYGDTYQMPPKSQLPAEEIAALVEWVRIGAPWGADSAPVATANSAVTFNLAERAKHWSFQPLTEVVPPQVGDSEWIKTAVDRFIVARLQAAGLSPAPPATKHELLRRVTYDLIGLPPTLAEIEAFTADDSPGAYERVVDRLLASPRYGERWARHWLDLVRYAETCGHEFDFDLPNAYRYRDYVIRAFNEDLPYDQFVVEHLAGDLLPVPRRHPQDGFNESIIATGCFFFGEAKHSPVDVREDEADRIDNQIDVLAKTFLGLTVSCARCHDHKFDAISTKDYYALAGYLQSSRYQQAFIDSPERTRGPVEQLRAIRAERQQVAQTWVRASLVPRLGHLAEALSAAELSVNENWSKQLHQTALARSDDVFHAWAVLSPKQAEGAADNFAERRIALAAQLAGQLAGDSTASGPSLADFQGPHFEPWQATGEAFSAGLLTAGQWSVIGALPRVPGQLASSATAHSGLLSGKLRGVLRSPTFEIVKPRIWYRLHGTGGQVRLIVDGLQLIQDPIYGGLKFDAGGPELHWREQDVSKWIGHRAYVEIVDDDDGSIAVEEIEFCDNHQPAVRPNRLIARMLDDPSIDSPALLASAYQRLFQQAVASWLDESNSPPADAADRAAILRAALEQLPPNEHAATEDGTFRAQMTALDERQSAVESQLAAPRRAMALADGSAENERVFIRGSHKTLGEEVPRRFLEALGGTRTEPPQTGSGRLELARTIVSPENPLPARVIVNRLWHHHFGSGLVRSTDDFGVMGQRPTHPELLDYLAGQLVREGWSIKGIHRLMVLSSTYQMSSRLQADADRTDPENKLLHRMTVRRLEGEAIRDAMLSVSGGICETMYGPSVMPHLTPFMTGRGRPTVEGPLDGDGRRSIYLAVRRNFLTPMFLAFDYPTPFTTIGRRSVSNVPAQALAMMNNPLVLQQAKLWGTHMASDASRSPAERVRAMYLAAYCRPPEDAESQAALLFLNDTAAGPSDPRAWSELAHVLFNVKEFIYIP
jgi:mono/diheme cytochrome c family protein